MVVRQQDPNYAHQVPIYASSTYVYDTAEQGMRRFSGEEEGLYLQSAGAIPPSLKQKIKLLALETFGLDIQKQKPFFIHPAWQLFQH